LLHIKNAVETKWVNLRKRCLFTLLIYILLKIQWETVTNNIISDHTVLTSWWPTYMLYLLRDIVRSRFHWIYMLWALHVTEFRYFWWTLLSYAKMLGVHRNCFQNGFYDLDGNKRNKSLLKFWRTLCHSGNWRRILADCSHSFYSPFTQLPYSVKPIGWITHSALTFGMGCQQAGWDGRVEDRPSLPSNSYLHGLWDIFLQLNHSTNINWRNL
jgi:hypothetical protein